MTLKTKSAHQHQGRPGLEASLPTGTLTKLMFNIECCQNDGMAMNSPVLLSHDLPSHLHTFAHAVPSTLFTFPPSKLHLLQFPFFKVQLKVVQPRQIWVLVALCTWLRSSHGLVLSRWPRPGSKCSSLGVRRLASVPSCGNLGNSLILSEPLSGTEDENRPELL